MILLAALVFAVGMTIALGAPFWAAWDARRTRRACEAERVWMEQEREAQQALLQYELFSQLDQVRAARHTYSAAWASAEDYDTESQEE